MYCCFFHCNFKSVTKEGVRSSLRFMTRTARCVFAAMSSRYYIVYRLTHCLCFCAKIMSTNENPLYICEETVHTHFECTTTMGEALINLVCQYLALLDKQCAKYKDNNYKCDTLGNSGFSGELCHLRN